jgi:hypothetical protein
MRLSAKSNRVDDPLDFLTLIRLNQQGEGAFF